MNHFPDFPDDIKTDRRLVLVVLGISLAGASFLWLTGISREVMPWLCLALLVAIILAWRGRLVIAGWFAPFAGLVILVTLIFQNYGIRDTALLGFPVTIVAASLMNGRRGVIIFGLTSLAAVVGLGWAEFSGLVSTVFSPRNSLADYVVVCLVIILTIAFQLTVISRLAEKNRRVMLELAGRQRVEKALRESETRFRTLLENIPAITYLVGAGQEPNNPTLYISPQIVKLSKYTSAEFLADPGLWARLVHPDDLERVMALSMAGDEEGKSLVSDYRIIDKQQQVRWIHDEIVLVNDDDGRPLYRVGVWTDVTEQKQAELALRESEERYRSMVETFPDIVLLTNPHGQVLFANAALEQQLGYSLSELQQLEKSIIHPEDADLIRQAVRKLLASDRPCSDLIENRVIDKAGEVHWYSGIISKVQWNGELALQTVTRDITSRKQAEQAAAQTASQLAVLNEIGRAVSEEINLEAVLEIIRRELQKLVGFDFYSVRIFNPDRQTVTHLAVYESGRYWPEADTPLYPGTDAQRVFETGQSILHLYTPEELETYRTNPYIQIGDPGSISASVIFAPLKKQGQVIGALSVQRRELNAYTLEHLKLVEAVAIQVAIAIENARLFASLQKELQEHRQAEELVKQVNFELQRRLKELYALNAVAQSGASARSEPEIIEVVVETLYRSLYPDLVGVALWDQTAGVLRTYENVNRGFPANINRNELIARLNEGVVGKVAATRQPWRIKDVSLEPNYLCLDPAIRSELCVPILAGEKLLGAIDIESKQLDAFSQADENLLVTIAGQLASAMERLRAEQQLRTVNAELEQRVIERTAQLELANRELESFSYSVSHDLRAPLRAMNGFARILREDFAAELSPPARGFLEKIATAGSQMSHLIDELLDFSRIGRRPLNQQLLDMNELTQVVIASLAPETASRQIEWVLAEMPPAHADPLLLQQVYANLLANAVKYSGKRLQARIEVGSYEQNRQVVYYVRDNGAGFDMQYIDKLFGVFQRLHREDEFEGIGIGLAIVKRIIERHGGRIWAEAAVEQGATFYFTLERPTTP